MVKMDVGSMFVRPELCEDCLYSGPEDNNYHAKCIPGQWEYRGDDYGCINYNSRIEGKGW